MPDPDQPVAQRRVRAAGQLVDAAFGCADHIAAGVARVPDLVEDEAESAGSGRAGAPPPLPPWLPGAPANRGATSPVDGRLLGSSTACC